ARRGRRRRPGRASELPRRRLPATGGCGTREGVEHRHVRDRVLEGYGDRPSRTDRAREEVSLQRVLVARLERERLDSRPECIPAVVEEDAARTIRRGVERDLDLDPRLGPEE